MQNKFYIFIMYLVMWGLINMSLSQPGFTQNYKVRVVVNGDAITDLDIERRVKLLSILQGEAPPPKIPSSTRQQVQQILIDEKLLEQDAHKHKISVDKNDLAQAWNSIGERNHTTVSVLKTQMKNSNLDIGEFEEQLRHQILQAKILRLVIEPQVNVSELEIQQLLQTQHTPDTAEQEVRQTAQQLMLLLKMRDYVYNLRRHAYVEIKK